VARDEGEINKNQDANERGRGTRIEPAETRPEKANTRSARGPLGVLTGRLPLKATHKVVASLAGAVLLVAFVVAGSFWAFGQIEKAATARKHSYNLLSRAENLLSALKDAETGQRGYSLTGDEAFLEPYLAVRDSVGGQLEELRQLTLIDAAHKHLDAMVPLVDARMAESSRVIELRRNHDITAVLAAVGSGRGRRLMDSIRAEMSSFIQIEEVALAQREAAFQSDMRRLFAIIVIASVLMLAFSLLCVYFIYRETQSRLKNTGALQSAIFNSANFSSIATDAKGVIQIFNVGAERMLGYTAADVMNKITPADISDPHEVIARAKALSAELDTPIAPGFEALVFKASRGIEDIYELTYIRKDGSRFPAVVSVTALRDGQGAIIGYLLIGTDNTARKQVEEERMKLDQRLRDQQFYTRSLIESNIDAIMTTDPLGIITDVNKQMEALTGCTRDELIGAPFKNYFTDPDRAETSIKLVLSEKKVTNYELTARARDGKETVVSYNATTFYDRNRRLQGVFAAARDVTERNAYEQRVAESTVQLQAANQELETFSYSVSHDLRAPLRHILGFVDLLKKDAGPSLSENSLRHLTTISEAAKRMGDLIDDLLAFSRVGRAELQKTNINLNELVRETLGDFQAETNERHIAWEIHPLPPVRADRALLRMVLVNLMSNAVKFTGARAEAKIEIGSAPNGNGETVIFIRDNGAGFDPKYTGKLFGVFQRLHSHEEFEGTGIGLANVQRIINRHGGRVWAEGVVDGGATFTFSIPKHSEAS
jgi:PAS domain S-box-containing protein